MSNVCWLVVVLFWQRDLPLLRQPVARPHFEILLGSSHCFDRPVDSFPTLLAWARGPRSVLVIESSVSCLRAVSHVRQRVAGTLSGVTCNAFRNYLCSRSSMRGYQQVNHAGGPASEPSCRRRMRKLEEYVSHSWWLPRLSIIWCTGCSLANGFRHDKAQCI